MLFSSKGTISTSVAMMECASSQGLRGGEVFLLSELEKVWASLSILMGKHLLEGRNVQVAQWGAFWLEELYLATDVHHQRYCSRRLCFGVHPHVATRYHINTNKVPLQKRSLVYAKILPSHIVSICGVPAHRATLALREFFLYIGEELFRGKIFEIRFPGVGTVLLRKEQLQLTTDWELQMGLFDVDSKRWMPEMRDHCKQVLQDLRTRGPVSSPSSSRPSKVLSRCVWQPAPAVLIDPSSVFTSSAPAGRLFSEIEKEHTRRCEEKRTRLANERELPKRLVQMNGNGFGRVPTRFQDPEMERPGSGESIYNVLPKDPYSTEDRCRCATSDSMPVHDDNDVYDEADDVEVVEVCVDEVDLDEDTSLPRPLGHKNPALESVLQQEEAFSRPISRRTYHEHSSVRDLLYHSEGSEEGARPLTAVSTNNETQRYGRKRFDVGQPALDHVGGLLKGSVL